MAENDDESASIDLAGRKEEAFRLKTLAEERYNSGDLDSAVAYADRAHDLHPAVSGLRQMRTAFEILRAAAASPILDDGCGEKQRPTPDYYMILQVPRFSHINSIKKQYKKLALTLHPDKNPFAASEEAFKLVGEAARVLSDKARRKEYDVRLRIAMQSEAAEAVAVEAGDEEAGETFWTTCSACRLLHQFQRKYLGHNLVCPKCKKTFKAMEVEKGKDDEGNGGAVGKNEGAEGSNTRASARIQERVAKGGYVGSVEKFGLGAKRRNSNLGEVSEKSEAKVARTDEKFVENGDVGNGKFKRMETLINLGGVGRVKDGGEVGIVDNGTSKEAEVGEEESMTLSQMQMMVKKRKKTKKLVKEKPSTEAKAVNAEKLMVNEMEEETHKDEGQREKENVREEDSLEEMQSARVEESVEEMENVRDEQRAKEMADKENERDREKEVNVRRSSNRRRVSKVRNLEEEKSKEMEEEAEKEREEDAVKEKEANARGSLSRRRVSKVRNLEEESSKEMEEGAEKEREGEEVKEKEPTVRSCLNRRRVSKVRHLEEQTVKEMEETEKEGEEEAVKVKEVNTRGSLNRRRGSKVRNLEEERAKETEGEAEKEAEEEVVKEKEAKVTGSSNRKRLSNNRNLDEERVKEREEEAEREKEVNLRGNLKRRRVQKVKNTEVVNTTSKNHLDSDIVLYGSPEKDNSEIIVAEKEKEKEMGVTKDKRERRRVSKYRNPNTLSGKSSQNQVDSDVERLLANKNDNFEIMAVEDSDFHDFDKDRRERSFKKGQVWAVYDDVDAMPRHYALINKIGSLNPFEVTLSWLELQTNRDEELADWLNKGFNVSCGIFQVSSEVTVRCLNLFSHLVYCERAARELYRIYPRKGSIWAVYSTTDREAEETNKARCYGTVVILSNYSDVYGLSIAYLEKVEGFKTVFKRRDIGAKAVVCLGAKDMKIFSHQIPAKKLSGEEASGLPKVCWELDPASLAPQMLQIAS